MARLVVRFPDGTPYGGARQVSPEGTLDYQLRNRRLDPPDERPKITATERMWWRKSESLAYPTGAEFPIEELPLLIGDAERLVIARGEAVAPVNPQRRNGRPKPARPAR